MIRNWKGQNKKVRDIKKKMKERIPSERRHASLNLEQNGRINKKRDFLSNKTENYCDGRRYYYIVISITFVCLFFLFCCGSNLIAVMVSSQTSNLTDIHKVK